MAIAIPNLFGQAPAVLKVEVQNLAFYEVDTRV
jgi:hypothetical protein